MSITISIETELYDTQEITEQRRMRFFNYSLAINGRYANYHPNGWQLGYFKIEGIRLMPNFELFENKDFFWGTRFFYYLAGEIEREANFWDLFKINEENTLTGFEFKYMNSGLILQEGGMIGAHIDFPERPPEVIHGKQIMLGFWGTWEVPK